jgi:hypothetical protein
MSDTAKMPKVSKTRLTIRHENRLSSLKNAPGPKKPRRPAQMF